MERLALTPWLEKLSLGIVLNCDKARRVLEFPGEGDQDRLPIPRRAFLSNDQRVALQERTSNCNLLGHSKAISGMCRRIPALDVNICTLDDPKLSCGIVVGAGAVKRHSVRVAKDRTTLDRQQSWLRRRRRQGCRGRRGDEDRCSGGIAAEKWHKQPQTEQGQQSCDKTQ